MAIPKKQIFKRVDRICHFCKEDDYALLDAHRIIPGSKGGKYTRANTVTTCAKCHRKIHEGRIEILSRHFTTAGVHILHYIEDGVEKWG